MGLLVALRIIEGISCFTGFIYWKKLRPHYWKYFPIYLLFIVMSEFTGRYFKVHDLKAANYALYNYLVIPAEFLFFFWMFYHAFKKSRYKWLPVWSAGLYISCWLVDIFYLGRLHFFFYSFSYTTGNLFLLVLILLYFIRLVLSDAILGFKRDIMFWISAGLLLYYLGTFPYYGLRNTIAYNYPGLNIAYSHLVYLLNCLMYLMFTLGFVWGRPNTGSSSF